MNARDFLTECKRRGISITVDHGDLIVRPENIPAGTVKFLKQHKREIIDVLRPPLACLLRLPDNRQFWVAPDGMAFDSRNIPVIRHSVMDKLIESGSDIQTEIMRLIDGLHILGGEVFINTPLPGTKKAVTSDLRRSDHG